MVLSHLHGRPMFYFIAIVYDIIIYTFCVSLLTFYGACLWSSATPSSDLNVGLSVAFFSNP